jgi:hypothetical protein
MMLFPESDLWVITAQIAGDSPKLGYHDVGRRIEQ